jgi:hypothetical protein
MRRSLALLPLLMGGGGCCHCGNSFGWSFQMGKPATVSSATIVHPMNTGYATSGVASGPTLGVYGPVATPPAPVYQQMAPAPCGPVSLGGREPTLRELHESIEGLRKSLPRPAPGEMLPLPRKCPATVEARLDGEDQAGGGVNR